METYRNDIKTKNFFGLRRRPSVRDVYEAYCNTAEKFSELNLSAAETCIDLEDGKRIRDIDELRFLSDSKTGLCSKVRWQEQSPLIYMESPERKYAGKIGYGNKVNVSASKKDEMDIALAFAEIPIALLTCVAGAGIGSEISNTYFILGSSLASALLAFDAVRRFKDAYGCSMISVEVGEFNEINDKKNESLEAMADSDHCLAGFMQSQHFWFK